MVNTTYLINEKNPLAHSAVAVYSVEAVFRQVMMREFPEALVASHDEDDYALDVYELDGSAVIVNGGKVNIISSDENRLAATKNSLEERLRYFTLTENNHTETE